jgi:tagatose 1,6-diphosphate aldolase
MKEVLEKRLRIERLRDKQGKFCMMGIGAVEALKEMLSKRPGKPCDQVGFSELFMFKKVTIGALAPYFSAISTDPVYGYPACIEDFPEGTGLILSVQESGYKYADRNNMERLNCFLKEWVDGEIWSFRFDALKLTIYYRDEASPEVKEHQKNMAIEVGKRCIEHNVPYILEIMSYPLLKEEIEDPAIYAKRLPEIVVGYVKEFSNTNYNADLLKIDFPGDLKYCEDFANKFGESKKILYNLSEIDEYCREVLKISTLPWVILSGGVGFNEFVERVKIACRAGASGFLGGRAIWGGAADFFPDIGGVKKWLENEGIERAKKLRNAVYKSKYL